MKFGALVVVGKRLSMSNFVQHLAAPKKVSIGWWLVYSWCWWALGNHDDDENDHHGEILLGGLTSCWSEVNLQLIRQNDPFETSPNVKERRWG